MANIFKAIRDSIEKIKMEREKRRELDKLIKEFCSNEWEQAHHSWLGTHVFKEITPFLKPCPHCGSEVELSYKDEMHVYYHNRYVIRCHNYNTGCNLFSKMSLHVTPDTLFCDLSEETREKYMRQIINDWNNQEEKNA